MTAPAPAPDRSPLAAVPSLDDLARDPQVVQNLPPAVAAALLPSALYAVGVLLARVLTADPGGAPGGTGATAARPTTSSGFPLTR